jgi:serine/threonine protein kinase
MPTDPKTLIGSPVKETVPQRRVHDFQILPNVIGKGAYSTVYLARDPKTNELLAAKAIDLRLHNREFESEVAVLSTISNGNLIKYRGSEVMGSVGFIFMDYVSHPTLSDYLKQSGGLPEKDSLRMFSHLVEALESLHGQGVAHKDLKPENVFIDPVTHQIKVIDFGLSVVVSEGELVKAYCGSPMFMAPEVLNRDPHDPLKSDIWSLGVILYQTLVGTSPWSEAESLDDLLDLVIFEPQVSLPSFISEPVRSLLASMLMHEPRKRPNIQQIRQHLISLGL